MAIYSDVLLTPVGGVMTAWQNVWVRLVNNDSLVAYVSDAATPSGPTSTGRFVFSTKPPGGSYTVYTGPTNTGAWTGTGETGRVIGYGEGDHIVGSDFTANPVSPYAPATFILAGENVSAINPYNVKEYGANARGNDADAAVNLTAIQAAINAAVVAGGGTVLFPKGIYPINGTLTLNGPNVILKGEGKRTSIIRRVNTTNLVVLQISSTANADNCTIRDLGWDCNGANQSSNQPCIQQETSLGFTSNNLTVAFCAFFNVFAWAFITRAFSFPSQQTQNCRILFNDVIAISGATNDYISVTSNGGMCAGNVVSGFGFAFINIYECNNYIAWHNTITMTGTLGSAALRLSSCVDCAILGNIVTAAANDICIGVLKETDNGGARNSSVNLVADNICVGGATTIAYQIDGNAGSVFNTSIKGGVIDGCGKAFVFGSNTINTVVISDVDYYNGTTPFTFTVTPSNLSVDLAGNAGFAGHLATLGTAPATSNLGANVTSATFTGNDYRGDVAVVMAGALAANSRVCTVTFNQSFGPTAPRVLLINMTATQTLAATTFYVSAVSTGVSFDLSTSQALAAGTYHIGYIVFG